MALPTFEQQRRIDLVDAVNELSSSTQAAFDDLEVELPIASADVVGGIKVGENLTITEDGTLNAQAGGAGDVTKEYVDAQVAGVEAHLETFEQEAVTKATGENAISATVAQSEGGATLTVSLKYGAGLAVQNGALVATGGGTGGGDVARADVIDIVKQALQSAVLTDNGTLTFTLPE